MYHMIVGSVFSILCYVTLRHLMNQSEFSGMKGIAKRQKLKTKKLRLSCSRNQSWMLLGFSRFNFRDFDENSTEKREVQKGVVLLMGHEISLRRQAIAPPVLMCCCYREQRVYLETSTDYNTLQSSCV